MGIVRQMIQQEVPPPAVEKALAGLDEAIRGTVPPIWIEPMADWAGYCAYHLVTEGEIHVSDTAVGARFDPDRPGLARKTRDLILHEYSHRLIGVGHGHDGAFAAMRLTLAFRANNMPDADEHPDWWHVNLYDFHDHHDDPLISMPQALAWAWAIAQELSKTGASAAECAAQIKTRWASYLNAQEHRAERVEQRKAQQKQAIADAKRAADKEKRVHRNDKIALFLFGLVGWAGLMLAIHR